MPGIGLTPTSGLASFLQSMQNGTGASAPVASTYGAQMPSAQTASPGVQTGAPDFSKYDINQVVQALRQSPSTAPGNEGLLARQKQLLQDPTNFQSFIQQMSNPMLQGKHFSQSPFPTAAAGAATPAAYKPFTPSINFNGAFTDGSTGQTANAGSSTGTGGMVAGLDTTGMPDWLVQSLKNGGT